MASMLSMLERSKSSGSLNFFAPCQVARERSGYWRGERGGGASHMQGARLEGTHLKHAVHGCDAGRVEVQRPVELLRALPSRKGEVIRSGMGYWPGGETAVGAVVELAARREAARLEAG
eukprot:scaffold79336_cov57-Phaeocystis_antarctica.AAC.2